MKTVGHRQFSVAPVWMGSVGEVGSAAQLGNIEAARPESNVGSQATLNCTVVARGLRQDSPGALAES